VALLPCPAGLGEREAGAFPPPPQEGCLVAPGLPAQSELVSNFNPLCVWWGGGRLLPQIAELSSAPDHSWNQQFLGDAHDRFHVHLQC
jgi:hypothetical protein